MRKKTKEVIRRVGYLMAVVAAVCGGIAIVAVCLTRKWFVKSWGDVSIEELVFQLKVPLETSLTEELQNLFQYVVPSVIIWGIILLIVMISIRVHRFVAGVLGFCILCSSFPEKKRNLIYIFLESMENTYMSKLDGGAYDINYIPDLTALAEENLNFSHTDQVG